MTPDGRHTGAQQLFCVVVRTQEAVEGSYFIHDFTNKPVKTNTPSTIYGAIMELDGSKTRNCSTSNENLGLVHPTYISTGTNMSRYDTASRQRERAIFINASTNNPEKVVQL